MSDQEFGRTQDGILRRLPYPYRAMLAICSDLDETPDRHVYGESMRFMNTTEMTTMGGGVGLEVGNSIYFDMPPGQFAYWNTDEAGRNMIRSLIHSGHIDCFHSYGDLATSRKHAEAAIKELARHNCLLKVWIDHGTAPSNFGGDIMQGHGDVNGSGVYHADLTCNFGVEYVWRGRVTSVIGQGVPRSLAGIFDLKHPADSARTITKEFIKGCLAMISQGKYAIHGPNEVLTPVLLRSGHRVWEFLRANPHWGGVSSSDTADGLADVLTERILERLTQRDGACVLYTHLGKVTDRRQPFGSKTIEALRRLARYSHEGRILVTTTRRLLDYYRTAREAHITIKNDRKETSIHVTGNVREENLDGLTVYTENPDNTRLFVNGIEVSAVQRNKPDQSGVASVSVPWKRLDFPVF